MFSLDNFYFILYRNLLQPARIAPHLFHPFGSTDPRDMSYQNFNPARRIEGFKNLCFFWDQEPLVPELYENFANKYPVSNHLFYSTKMSKILANSEHSDYKRHICRQDGFIDWYYFFHGFAALDWYRDYQYIPQVENNFSKVFISLNRLCVKDRSYRLTLVSLMMEQGLLDKGSVSLSLKDQGEGTWQDELDYGHSKLSVWAKNLVENNIGKLQGSLVVDRVDPQGFLSAATDSSEMYMQQNALWHLVGETIFYYPKLHLTEKVFKPIVNRRPFILAGGPGNLAYLKSYGFKTFDRWIDESYDQETDNDRRLTMIVDELNKLCSLSMSELKAMHKDMQTTLDYNFQHFFGNFKSIIVDEMLDNFKSVAAQWNNGRFDRLIELDPIDFPKVRNLLTK